MRESIAQHEARPQAAVESRKMEEAARRTWMVPPTLLKQYDTNAKNLIDLSEWKLYRQNVARQTAAKRTAPPRCRHKRFSRQPRNRLCTLLA